MADKITLICTSLNPDEKLLNKMLKSAIGFDEIILHIDINTQKMPDVEWAGSPISFVTTPAHCEIGIAYNWIIKNFVETPWVCCFCDDDYFYPEGLSKMIDIIHNTEGGLACGVAHFKFHISGYLPEEDIRGQYYKIFGNSEYDLFEKKPITVDLLKNHNRLPAGAFFRKQAWEMAGGFLGDTCHDWDLWKRMIKAGIEFKYFDYLVYNFVRRENSAWIRQNRPL